MGDAYTVVGTCDAVQLGAGSAITLHGTDDRLRLGALSLAGVIDTGLGTNVVQANSAGAIFE